MTILFTPLFPLYVLAAFALAALLMLTVGLLRRARGVILRALLFALLLLALADPSLIAEQRIPVTDQALVVIDDSASMQLGERTGQAAKAVDALANKLAGAANLETETIHVSGEDQTDLYHAIDAKLANHATRSVSGHYCHYRRREP